VRAVKNRFGRSNEVAIYQMHDTGLEEVPNPSAALLSQRSGAAGSAIVAAVEGTRPLLIEMQALVSPTTFPSPRRMAIGIDANRVSLLLAVLEKRTGGNFMASDVYVNVAGDCRLTSRPSISVSWPRCSRRAATRPSPTTWPSSER